MYLFTDELLCKRMAIRVVVVVVVCFVCVFHRRFLWPLFWTPDVNERQ